MFLLADLRVNVPLAQRYQDYASELGVNCPSRCNQEDILGCASTDQGNVSYEVLAIQPVYKIDVSSGEANHTAGFAKVLLNAERCPLLITWASKGSQAHERTVLSSKAVAYIAMDYLMDADFRINVRLQYAPHERNHNRVNARRSTAEITSNGGWTKYGGQDGEIVLYSNGK